MKPLLDTEGTMCDGGDFSPHKMWRGLKLPIKVITPKRNLGKLPKPDSFDGYQLFVLPGGGAVYFIDGLTPVFIDELSVPPLRVIPSIKSLARR
tara:strand:- start:17933 stop:18214 length:282 start_codon:yes stop_codon:yes gene_type:complete